MERYFDLMRIFYSGEYTMPRMFFKVQACYKSCLWRRAKLWKMGMPASVPAFPPSGEVEAGGKRVPLRRLPRSVSLAGSWSNRQHSISQPDPSKEAMYFTESCDRQTLFLLISTTRVVVSRLPKRCQLNFPTLSDTSIVSQYNHCSMSGSKP